MGSAPMVGFVCDKQVKEYDLKYEIESQKRWILNLGLKLVQQKHPANTS